MSGFVISVDRNQAQIIADLKKMGVQCRSVAGARGCGFDIVCTRYGINLLVEIKREGKKKDLRPSETWMRDNWKGPFLVSDSADEIAAWFVVNA